LETSRGQSAPPLPPTSTFRTSVKFRRRADEASPLRTPRILAHVEGGAPARIVFGVMDVSVVPLSPDLLLLHLSSMNFKTSKQAVAMNQVAGAPSFRTKESVGGFAEAWKEGSDCSLCADIRNRIREREGDKVLPVKLRQPISDFSPIAPPLALFTAFLQVVPMPRRMQKPQSSRLPESTNRRRFRHQKASGLSGLTRLRGLRNGAQISGSAVL